MQLQDKLHANAEFSHVLSLLPPVHIQHGPWITGGAARRLWLAEDWHKGDVDVFFVNEQQRVEWLAEFDRVWNYTYHKQVDYPEPHKLYELFAQGRSSPPRKHVPQANTSMETENAITFDLNYQLPEESEIRNCKLQVIKVRYAASLQELWKAFDFNVCCFAADALRVYADQAALRDAHAHEITVRHDHASKNLPLRVFKHFSQGYLVSDDLLKQAMRQIAEKDVDWCNNY
jgi:hypothetical protein